MSGRICIFAKPPVPTRVKTRLAAVVGPQVASAFAAAFLEDTVASMGQLEATLVLATTEPDGPFPPLAGRLPRWPQGDGDLGPRLARIFRRALDDAPWAIAVGADSPGMPAAILSDAVRALRSGARSVMVGALDGGFCLLGLADDPPGLFDAVPWSGPEAAQVMLARLTDLGLRPEILAPWFDVDEHADLLRLERLLTSARASAPATARLLARREREVPHDESLVSAIIPTCNDESVIGAHVQRLAADPTVGELLVIDAGSDDATLTRARSAGAFATIGPRDPVACAECGAAVSRYHPRLVPPGRRL